MLRCRLPSSVARELIGRFISGEIVYFAIFNAGDKISSAVRESVHCLFLPFSLAVDKKKDNINVQQRKIRYSHYFSFLISNVGHIISL